MKITPTKRDNELELVVEDRLDTNTAPELDKAISEILDEDNTLVIFDFENLEYISSAGLRVILSVLKKPAKSGRSVTVKHPNERIQDILYNTGFDDLVDIQLD